VQELARLGREKSSLECAFCVVSSEVGLSEIFGSCIGSQGQAKPFQTSVRVLSQSPSMHVNYPTNVDNTEKLDFVISVTREAVIFKVHQNGW
jgi:hypothetical protein